MSSVYKTPGSDFDTFCENIKQLYVATLMLISSNKEHNRKKSCVYCMYGLSLFPSIDKPNRITSNSCILIDNIFINQTHYLIRTSVITWQYLFLCNYEIETHKRDFF